MGRPGVAHKDRIVHDKTYFTSRSRIDANGCWLWILHINSRGYGEASNLRKRVVAHRFAYESLIGKVPEGLQLDHLCRVRACINPAHLEPVTPQVNNARSTSPSAINAKKTHCVHGHPFSGSNLSLIVLKSGKPKRICRTCTRTISKTFLERKRGYSLA